MLASRNMMRIMYRLNFTPCVEFFKTLSSVFLPLKVSKLYTYLLERGKSPLSYLYSDFRVIYRAGNQEKTKIYCIITHQLIFLISAMQKNGYMNMKVIKVVSYLLRQSFFSSLVKQLSRCLFMYCSGIATWQTGQSTESKEERIYQCVYYAKSKCFNLKN